MTSSTGWTHEPTVAELVDAEHRAAARAAPTPPPSTGCRATIEDPAGSGLRVRCVRDLDHPHAPSGGYVDSQTATETAHAGTTSLGALYHWWDSADGARPDPSRAPAAPARPEAIEHTLEDAGVPTLAPTGYTHEHRTFRLQRATDHTGVSGTGLVAEGVQFSDGRVALRWIGAQGKPSTACWDSLGDMLEVHGHDGATTVEWT